jgi:HEAT repeat protein
LLALDDHDANVRREAVGVLGWLKQLDALPALARLASDDPDTEVRRAATGALGLASDARCCRPCEALQDQAWQVREEAATTLGKVGHADAGAALDRSLGRRLLASAPARHPQSRAFALCPGPRCLIETLGHRISNLRKEAALALGELNERGAIAPLLAAQDDGDPEVRKRCALP